MSMKISNDTMRSRACGFPAFSAVCPHTHIYIKVNFGHIENSVQGNKEIVNSGLLWCDAVLLGEIFLFQRNVRNHLPIDTVSHPRRPECSTTQL